MKIWKLSAAVAIFVIALILSVFIIQILLPVQENPPAPPQVTPQPGHTHINPQPGHLNITWSQEGVNDENLENVAMASDNFGLTLLSKMLNGSNNNTIISPLSIWLALSMLYEGARGETASEMRNVMYLPNNTTILHQNIHWFLEKFENHTENYTLSIPNALWAQNNTDIEQEYVQILEDYYNAYFRWLNFMENPEGARNIINSWVENQTHGKIKNLLPEGSITPYTIAVITNAIYFHAAWEYAFNKSLTTKDFFYTPDGKVMVNMMHKHGEFNYTENNEAQVLELPYNDTNLSMLIVLPKGKTLNLTLENLLSWRNNLGDAHVNISLPKFNLTTGYELKKYLEEMGMKSVFSPSANLTGMFPGGGIWASNVYHKTYISMDEKSTEAAAATGIPVGYGIVRYVDFRVNHPFLFLIQDSETGAIFFMGWVVNPTG